MTEPSIHEDRQSYSLAGFSVVRALGPGATFLCLDDAGRKVVLKRLERDCLLGAQLHPSIRERLMRIRELAHRQVATLRTVERTHDGEAWMVWDYVDGEPLEDYLQNPQARPDRLAGEIILAVESLHALGIVHGALHARNIIVGPRGEIRLTHLSPLLYSDPAEDVASLGRLLSAAMQLPQIDGTATTLRQLHAQCAMMDAPADRIAAKPSALRLRRRSVLAATAVTALAILTSFAIYRAAARSRSAPSPRDFDRLDTVAPTR